MATRDVISDVGETIVRILEEGIPDTLVAQGHVLMTTTDEMRTLSLDEPAVTLFLYEISANAELRNSPPAPGFSRPRLPLDLRFLITPWAKDAGTIYQICGYVLQTLYDHSHLARGDLFGQSSWGADDTLQILLDPAPVSERHQIWESGEIPFKLSLAYLVRVIGLDPGIPAETPIVATATTGTASQP